MIGLLLSFAEDLRLRAARYFLGLRVRAGNPTLRSHSTATWDYGYRDLDAIEIGRGVSVLANAVIVVRKHSPRSRHQGRLVLRDGVIVGEGVNIRAAGGLIAIGANSGVAQHCVLVAANHRIDTNEAHLRTSWDEVRTGVNIGDNVWIGANCTVLPGALIGEGAVIGAGSVVRGEIPPYELWGGVPARRIKSLPAGSASHAAEGTGRGL